MIKRIIRSLTVAALVVLALAVPAFAQEEIPCRNANGDETIRCDGELYVPYDVYGYYDEQPPWGDYGDEYYGYPPFGYSDEYNEYPPFDHSEEYGEYPPFGYGYGDDYDYDEDVQEAWDEFVEELEESGVY